MAQRPAVQPSRDTADRILDAVFPIILVVVVVVVGLVIASMALGPGSGTTNPAGVAGPTASGHAPSVDVTAYLLPVAREAPAIELTGADGRAFSLASLRGGPVLVFFGYTHCPDVCPATIGNVGLAMEAFGPGARAVFVTIDPERDTPAWLTEYGRYLPAGFSAVTGTSERIRSTADAWGVRYSRVETGVPGAYSMSHTADVYLVDGGGTLRARFSFGTTPEAMTAVLRTVVAGGGSPPSTAAPTATPSPSSTPRPTAPAPASGPPSARTATLGVDVVSTSVWSGAPGPVILALSIDGSRLAETTIRPTVQVMSVTGERIGPAVEAIPVRPPGLTTVSYVASPSFPTPGAWRIEVTATFGDVTRIGSSAIDVLDPGATASIGVPAPTVRTPTLTDVGGVVKAVTTDPAPDLRLSAVSTADALAAGQPFVLVIDSSRFRVSPACGRAIVMARYLLDRWRDVAFIHHEPYRYQVVADTAVLDGSLDAPKLTDPAAAWGIGGDPWGPRSMPWVFVVDGHGIVRARYQGVMGTDDVDVILALIAQGG